jgi:iron complex outermembrane recepter protein
VLQDGVRNGSLASQSGDHGEPIDTLNLERLEVIKGPATLLYGSNAIGGVVNAVTSDEDNPHDGWRLNLSGVAATNQRQLGTSGGVEYGFRKFLFNVHANGIREGDYRTPLGRVPNSSSRAYGGSTTLGYFGDKGFIAGGLHFDRRRYGVPYAPLFEEGVLLTAPNGEPCDLDGPNADECGYDVEAIRDRFSRRLPPTPEEEIDLKMRQDNLRLRAGFRNVAGPVQQGNFFLNITRYRHQEIETEDGLDEVATNFFNTTTSYRAFFQQAKHGVLSGRFGFEGHHRDYLTAGAEQLINGNVRQNNFAVFGLQELDLGRVSLQFGGRVETNRYRPSDLSLYEPRQFTGFSAAASARIRLWEGASFVTNFTSAYRPPSLEELYNEGPHIGTVTFEIGNQDLRRERSTGVEFSLRQRLDKVRMNGSVFFYNIDSFIFIAPRDLDRDGNVDVEDNLPVGEFQQQDARFVGADLSLEWDVRNWLGAYVTADMVRAELRPSGTPLPRITPPRLRLGTDLRYRGLSVRPELLLVGAKGRGDIFTLETPTAGYALLNVAASYSIARDRTVHTFSVSTSNLTDRLYRNHLSYIKDLAPEPGRNLRFSYTLRLF